MRGWLAEDAGLLGVLDGVKRASRDWALGSKAKPWSSFFAGMVPMTDNSKRTGAAIEAHYQFLAWLVPTIAYLAF